MCPLDDSPSRRAVGGESGKEQNIRSVAITTARTPPSICQGHGDRRATLVLNWQYQIASAPGKKFNQAAAGVQVTVAVYQEQQLTFRSSAPFHVCFVRSMPVLSASTPSPPSQSYSLPMASKKNNGLGHAASPPTRENDPLPGC